MPAGATSPRGADECAQGAFERPLESLSQSFLNCTSPSARRLPTRYAIRMLKDPLKAPLKFPLLEREP